jgi:integrase
MGHVEDRWYRTVKDAGGESRRVKSARFGKGQRYRVRYEAPDGRERSESFPDRHKRAAESFLATVESDKLRGTYIDPAAGRKPFDEFAEAWLRTHQLDESSRETTGIRVRRHIIPFFGKRSVSAITPGLVREWDAGLIGVLAVATRSTAFAHLSAILTAAVDDGLIAKNPCAAKSVTKPQPPRTKVVPWEVGTVMAIRSGLSRRYRPMVDIGAGCGLRQGEIFGLAPADFDFDGGWLHVRRQVKRVHSRLVFGLPKNNEERRTILPAGVGRVMREYFEEFPALEVSLPWEDPARGELVTVSLVFATPRRNAINRATFNDKAWHPALIFAGIEPTRATGMHALRHFFASVLLDKGESIKAVAEYLGHADPAFTLRTYTHLMPSSDRRARSAFDDLFGGPDDSPRPSHGPAQ